MNNPTQEVRARLFAQSAHGGHTNPLTGESYLVHLGQVVAVIELLGGDEVARSVGWLHDSMEDRGVSYGELLGLFGAEVADSVRLLSDLGPGDRKTRKQLSRERLAGADARTQLVKISDVIVNIHNIVDLDRKFAKVYLPEKAALLAVLSKAPSHAKEMASDILDAAVAQLNEIPVPLKAALAVANLRSVLNQVR